MSTQPAQPRHALFAATLVLFAGFAGAQAQVPDPGEAVQALLQSAEAEVAAAQALLAGLPQEVQGALAEHLAAAQAALQDAQGTVGDVAQQALQRAEAELAAAQALVEGLPGAAQQALQEHLAAAQAALAEAQAAALAAVRDARDQARGAACPASRDALLVGPLVVWTSCNMGPRSGLDADLLDGFQALDFLDRIAAEAAARAAGDARLHARVDTIKLDLEKQVAAEAAAREAGDSSLADALAREVGDRKAEVARLDGILARETAAREAADGAEASARAAADLALRADLDQEAADRAAADAEEGSSRKAADGTLRAGLDQEASDRRAALAAEGSAREAADAALAGRAQSLEGFVNGGDYVGTSAMLSGVATFGGTVGVGTSTPAGRLHVMADLPEVTFRNADPAPSAVTQSGLVPAAGFPASALDDSVDSLAWHTDSSQAGAWLRVDLGAGDARAYQKTRIYSTADSATVGRYDVQYSDDGSQWTTVFAGFFPSSRGWNEASWAPAGSHPSWRLLLTNTPGGGPWLTELEWYVGEARVRSGPGLVVLEGGDVGIGTDTPTAKLDVVGRIRARSGLSIGDVAEPVAGHGLQPGDVVVMDGFDAAGKLRVKKADTAYSREVAGVVSTDPSLVLAGLATDTPLAVSGIAPVKVTGSVARGDLLTTSSVRGHATVCKEPALCFGAVLGKALEAHPGGEGSVRALVGLS